MQGLGVDVDKIKDRIAFCNYLSVAQIFLQDNFLLERPLDFNDIKPRLLGHPDAAGPLERHIVRRHS